MIDAAIVPARPADAAWLAAIHAAAFPPKQAWSATVVGLQLDAPGGYGFAHPDGAMVLARATMDEAEILTLAVLPALRRGGLGRALLARAMAQALDLRALSMFLEVSVENAAARALYESAGFAVVGRRPRYYEDGADALVMRAGLLPRAD